jgi:hypothetical protein
MQHFEIPGIEQQQQYLQVEVYVQSLKKNLFKIKKLLPESSISPVFELGDACSICEISQFFNVN